MISMIDLLKVPSLSDLKIIAGQNGLSRQISTVTLLDAPDGPKWLKGGEFVLTSAYIFDNDYQLLEDYIKGLIKSGASGLGIKTGRFLDQVPERIIAIAGDNQFPIIQIPYHLVWTDIIAPFYKLKYGLHNHKKPVVIEPDMILPLFEASRWGGKRLLLQLTELFQMPLAVYKQDKTLVLNNGIYGVIQIGQAVTNLKVMPKRRVPQKLTVNDFFCVFFCLPVSYDGEREYLAAASEREEDIEELKKLIDLFESLSGKDILALREKSDAYRAFLHKVIGGTITPEETAAFEESRTGSRTDHIYTGMVVLAGADYLKLYDYFKEALELYHKGKFFKFETYLYDHTSQHQAVILWEIYSQNKINPNVWVKGFVPILISFFTENDQRCFGFSEISGTIKMISRLYDQALKAVRFGTLLWPRQHCHFYTDYAVYDLLCDVDLDTLNFDDCTVLLEHKSTMAFQPLEMAEIYIESGNYKRAAAKLFIHENTLRYRINKINELIGVDLDNPVEAYWFLTKIKLFKVKTAKSGQNP